MIHHSLKSCDTIVFKSRDIIHLCHKFHSVMIPTFDLFHHLTTVKRIRSCSTRPKLDFTSPVDLKRISIGYGTLQFFYCCIINYAPYGPHSRINTSLNWVTRVWCHQALNYTMQANIFGLITQTTLFSYVYKTAKNARFVGGIST